MAGKKVRRGPGRPKTGAAGVSHGVRAELGANTAVHVTMKVRGGVPSLRHKARYGCVRAAFAKFAASVAGFRLLHFAVQGNHFHAILEVDSKQALSLGMKKVAHSISRRINALNVRQGGSWLGRIFAERYHAHILRSPTEMANALRYLLTQTQHHFKRAASKMPDKCSSFAKGAALELGRACGYLLRRALSAYHPTSSPTPRSFAPANAKV